jgi:hypothetical protein
MRRIQANSILPNARDGAEGATKIVLAPARPCRNLQFMMSYQLVMGNIACAVAHTGFRSLHYLCFLHAVPCAKQTSENVLCRIARCIPNCIFGLISESTSNTMSPWGVVGCHPLTRQTGQITICVLPVQGDPAKIYAFGSASPIKCNLQIAKPT